MGTDNRFVGGAATVAQVDTYTPGGTIEADDIFILTITGWDGLQQSVSAAAGGTNASNVTSALTTAWNNSALSLVATITAADLTGTMTLTADTAGVAFSVVPTTTEADGSAADAQTFAITDPSTTKNEGPSDYSSVDNWSLGVIPVSTDDVYIEGAFTILYGFGQSAVELDSFNVSGARIGTNPASGWRPVPLEVRAPVAEIGYHYGPSTRTQQVPVILDFGSDEACTIRVHNSGSNGTLPAVIITSKQLDTTLEIRKGSVGFYNNSAGDAELDYINMQYVSNKAGDVDLFIEEGCTIDTINQKAGDLLLRSALTTAITIEAGTLKTEGSGAIPTLTDNGGGATLNSSGTVGGTGGVTLNGGVTDFTKSSVSRTATNVKTNPGATLKYDPAVLTLTRAAPDKPVTLTVSAA